MLTLRYLIRLIYFVCVIIVLSVSTVTLKYLGFKDHLFWKSFTFTWTRKMLFRTFCISTGEYCNIENSLLYIVSLAEISKWNPWFSNYTQRSKISGFWYLLQFSCIINKILWAEVIKKIFANHEWSLKHRI